MKRLILGATLGLATIGAGATQAAPSQPAPATATPAAAPATAVPTAPATAVPTAPPATAAPTPTYNFIYRATPAPATTPPAPGAPQITEIDLSDATIVTPGAIHVRVLTSDAVTSVIAQTFGRSIAIPQRSSGIFALDANISEIPAFLKGRSYAIDFVASVADGRKADVSLPLVLK